MLREIIGLHEKCAIARYGGSLWGLTHMKSFRNFDLTPKTR